MPIGAALPFLVSGASTLLNNVFGGIAARRERKFAKQNWNEMNAYNAPSAVMARYRAAGMNPGYAGQMNFANASPPPESANKTHAVEVPNQLDTLREYFSLKNAELENSRLQELVQQEKMNTNFRQWTDDYKIQSTLDESAMTGFRRERAIHDQSMWMDAFKNITGRNPYSQRYDLDQNRYQLESARASRESELFDITKQMSELDLDWKKLGISPNDNVFARILFRIFADRLKQVKPLVGSATNSLIDYFK